MLKRTILITGGQGDIARAIVQALHPLHASYTVHAPSHQELDVTVPTSIAEYLTHLGPLDVLINNAATIHPAPLTLQNLPVWETQLMTNLMGAVAVTAQALHHGASTILNIGSSAGKVPKQDWSAYCTAKAGLIMFTRCLALEGHQAICISPGRTKTKMRASLHPEEDPDTLLLPSVIAHHVLKALSGDYPAGVNVEIAAPKRATAKVPTRKPWKRR